MINFFRKIRKKMADDNKPMKYMRYAIGEIVLVVIGILIALSINNWNTARNLSERQTSFINQIISDLKKSEIELEKIKDFYFTRAEASSIITQSFWNHEIQNDSIFSSFSIPYLIDFLSSPFVPNTLTVSLISLSISFPVKTKSKFALKYFKG